MNHSLYTVALLSLAVSFFSVDAQADGVTKVQLSSTPIKINIVKAHCVMPQRARVRLPHKGRIKPIKTRYSRTNNLRKSRVMSSRKRLKRSRAKSLVKYHYIQSGDSLYKLAKKYNVTVKHIMYVNHLKSSVIKVGGKLKI